MISYVKAPKGKAVETTAQKTRRFAAILARGYRGQVQPGDVTDILRTEILFPTMHHAASFAQTMLMHDEVDGEIWTYSPAVRADIAGGTVAISLHAPVTLTVIWRADAIEAFS